MVARVPPMASRLTIKAAQPNLLRYHLKSLEVTRDVKFGRHVCVMPRQPQPSVGARAPSAGLPQRRQPLGGAYRICL